MSDVTGREWIMRLAQAADRQGLPLLEYVKPLSPTPSRYITRLRQANSPKPATVERITALIEGREVPPPPPNNFQTLNAFQRSGGSAEDYHRASAARVGEAAASRQQLELKIAIAEAAAAERRPGETLHDATRRIEQQIREQEKIAA